MTTPVKSLGTPFTLTKATVTLNGVDFTCLTNHLAIKPDVTKETAKSICGSVDYIGQVKWLFGLTLYQSFNDATATYQTLQAALEGGVPVPFTVRPYPGAASATNPEFSGMVIPEPFDIFDSDAGELVTTEIEWSITDEPTVTPDPGGNGVGVNGATGPTGGSE